ncbi:unnamed protein product [Trifolium pratense]|uniref:Uncharacterized protein n=1 Tax=Trifolium pratense TaxID=57577 RepID=A0ACB0LGF4_TRIPR|nr:unnamed protein product [Trifolium pratense]
MPRKSGNPKMGDRVTVLEASVEEIKGTLGTLVQQMAQLLQRWNSNNTPDPTIVPQPARDESVREESVEASTMNESRLAGKKVKLPLFDGDDPVAWITRAEIYFEVQQTPDEMRVKLSRLSMEGPTIHWFNLLMETEDHLSWEKLKKSLIARYGGRRLENPFEELSTLRQVGSVEEYVEAFELLSSQMMRIAKDVEEELREDDETEEGNFGRKGKTDHMGRSDWAGSISRAKNGSGLNPKDSNRNMKSGWANPSYKTGHSNQNQNTTTSLSSTARKNETERRGGFVDRWKGVRSIHNNEGESLNEEGEIVSLEAEEDNEIEEEVEAECKLIGVLGSMGEYKTMKIGGKLENIDVVVLIDSGASHNFISPNLATALGLAVKPVAERKIKLGDGHEVVSKGVCEGLSLILGNMKVVVDVLILDLGGLNVVLGVSWLCTLGKVLMDWKTLTMQFWHQGKSITLQGQGENHEKQCYLNSFLANRHDDGDWWMKSLHQEKKDGDGINHDLQKLLKKFAEVFQDTIKLPPMRSQAHQIKLFPEHGAVNVRPYRALNKAPVPDKYPIPIVDEQLDELFGATIFSKIDLKSGYHQIRVLEEDIHKTAFRTHNGHYEYLVMPFGLMNAPATFQATMNDLFRPYLRKFVLVFFDDILVYSKTMSEHLLHLEQVLAVLLENCFVANQKKCKFGGQHVDYLGHIISGKGVAVDPDKVKCVSEWPVPKNVKGVRGFLGLTGYYRKFIKDYGKIAKPLTELTKKDNFNWGPEAANAFIKLKLIMTTTPVLALPNFELPFEVVCDAAGRGIGAVLMQQKQPIAYFSKALSEGNLAKSVYEKELMALVLSIQHWRHYLLGKKFLVYTDHKSLKHFLQQRVSSPDQQCWLAKLLGYQFEVLYKPGPDNKAADALSRCYGEEEMKVLMSSSQRLGGQMPFQNLTQDADLDLNVMVSSPQWLEGQKLLKEAAQDAQIQKLISELTDNPDSKPGYVVQQGILFYHGRLVIPATSPSIPILLAEFHSTPIGGHSGFLRTYRRIAANIYWVGMQKVVRDFVRACDICQRQKYTATTPGGLLQPLPIPNAIWEDLSIDFITGLPKSKGFEAVLVVVDRLSKYSHFILLKHTYTAKSVAELFVKEVVRLHGIPSTIISDRDPLFISHFWSELFKLQGTKLKMSSAYHPETDGQTEVINRCLESNLRCFASDQPKSWAYWISWAEYWYNTTYHILIDKSPFEVVYGRSPPTLLRFLSNETKVAAVALELTERDEALNQLKTHLLKAQQQMKIYADKKRRDLHFSVGEWVFLKLRPHRQHSVIKRINQKLAARFYGPFQIVERVGAVAYKLELPASSKIHPIFHVSLLKKAVGDYPVQGELPKELEISLEEDIYPEKILGSRITLQSGNAVHQSLIQWKNKSLEEVTWEDDAFIAGQFPDFSLEDKALFETGGIDKDVSLNNNVGPKEWRVYSRKRWKNEKKKGNE